MLFEARFYTVPIFSCNLTLESSSGKVIFNYMAIENKPSWSLLADNCWNFCSFIVAWLYQHVSFNSHLFWTLSVVGLSSAVPCTRSSPHHWARIKIHVGLADYIQCLAQGHPHITGPGSKYTLDWLIIHNALHKDIPISLSQDQNTPRIG